jgi:hypothetical protein
MWIYTSTPLYDFKAWYFIILAEEQLHFFMYAFIYLYVLLRHTDTEGYFYREVDHHEPEAPLQSTVWQCLSTTMLSPRNNICCTCASLVIKCVYIPCILCAIDSLYIVASYRVSP